MRAVLGIDAAWSKHNGSGVALIVEDATEHSNSCSTQGFISFRPNDILCALGSGQAFLDEVLPPVSNVAIATAMPTTDGCREYRSSATINGHTYVMTNQSCQ